MLDARCYLQAESASEEALLQQYLGVQRMPVADFLQHLQQAAAAGAVDSTVLALYMRHMLRSAGDEELQQLGKLALVPSAGGRLCLSPRCSAAMFDSENGLSECVISATVRNACIT